MSGRGVKALAALLTESPSLLCLDLSGNNLYSRISLVAPAALAPFASALAPLGKALGSVRCKLQLLHLDHADIEHKGARHAGSCRAAAPQTEGAELRLPVVPAEQQIAPHCLSILLFVNIEILTH